MTAVDTPDYQRGVTSAQVPLGHYTAPAVSVVVGIPPSCETLVLLAGGESELINVSVVGVTSGVSYAVVPASAGSSLVASSVWFADVTSVIDAEVTVFAENANGGDVYVYADAGVHVVADARNGGGAGGVAQVIPVIPGTAASDHPATELQFVGGGANTNIVIVAAPGVGKRIRLFAGAITNIGALGALTDQVGANNLLFVQDNNTTLVLPDQGVPLTENSALLAETSSGTTYYTAFYTIETI